MKWYYFYNSCINIIKKILKNFLYAILFFIFFSICHTKLTHAAYDHLDANFTSVSTSYNTDSIAPYILENNYTSFSSFRLFIPPGTEDVYFKLDTGTNKDFVAVLRLNNQPSTSFKELPNYDSISTDSGKISDLRNNDFIIRSIGGSPILNVLDDGNPSIASKGEWIYVDLYHREDGSSVTLWAYKCIYEVNTQEYMEWYEKTQGSPDLGSDPSFSFSFDGIEDATRGDEYYSNPIKIENLESEHAEISITSDDGGKYSIDSIDEDYFTNDSKHVKNGDTVQVKLTAPDEYSTTASATLTISDASGTFSDTFEVTTKVNPELKNTTPDLYGSLGTISGVEPKDNQWVESNSITVSGITEEIPINIQGGEYAVNNGNWTSSDGYVGNGQKVKVRVKVPTSYYDQNKAVININGVEREFKVITKVDPSNSGSDSSNPFADLLPIFSDPNDTPQEEIHVMIQSNNFNNNGEQELVTKLPASELGQSGFLTPNLQLDSENLALKDNNNSFKADAYALFVINNVQYNVYKDQFGNISYVPARHITGLIPYQRNVTINTENNSWQCKAFKELENYLINHDIGPETLASLHKPVTFIFGFVKNTDASLQYQSAEYWENLQWGAFQIVNQ